MVLSHRYRAVDNTPSTSSLNKSHKNNDNKIATRKSQSNGKHPNNIAISKRLSTRLIPCFFATSFLLVTLNIWASRYLPSQYDNITSFLPLFVGFDQQASRIPTVSTRYGKPTNHACDGYRGVYHIEKGDIGGAAGTVFFQFVIGQLIWAEKYNFKPWIFFNNVSYIIYDPIVHGHGPGVNFTMQGGMNITYINRTNGHWRDSIPGPPGNLQGLAPKAFHFGGNGVWENYFEPVSDFVPGDHSCADKPLATMDLYLVTPGVHGFAEWAPRCWRYQYLPDYITKPHIPLQEWLEPQRIEANRVLNKYIHFLPHIETKAETVNPSCSLEGGNSCLGIHIRQSDKAAGRRQIQADEFLPYVEAFVKAGGRWVYMATDSVNVVEHIKNNWPPHINDRIRSMGDGIVRSKNDKAVFDIASHHRTNTEILIEILALSKCQFMIHGLSAVTETSIWINVDLHYTSVNLEDPDHLHSREFGVLVHKVLAGENATQVMMDERNSDWWRKKDQLEVPSDDEPTHQACNKYDGILLISEVGYESGTGTAFFTSVLNQLIYARRFNLKPWIHLGNESKYIYDEEVHGAGPDIFIEAFFKEQISIVENEHDSSYFYPGAPHLNASSKTRNTLKLRGSGIWESYFSRVSDFRPDDKSCKEKPIITIDAQMVESALNSWSPWSVKAWRYDNIPENLWKPEKMKLKTWMEPMRKQASEIIKEYFHFHPFLEQRAKEVNPVDNSFPCLAIHLRNSDKGKEKFRAKFPPNKFKDYLLSFIRAGGKRIYIASDSHRTLDYIREHFPSDVNKILRSQGPYVVRSTKKWPIHSLDKHHRTNSEVLVDILAMAKCSIFLHGNSAVSEAVIYLNPNLHNNSVNWEDPDRISVAEFESLSKQVLPKKDAPLQPVMKIQEMQSKLVSPTIIKGKSERKCRKNAIVYVAQKQHSSYRGRNSFDLLLKSLDLVHKNYLSLDNHADNTDLIIFHTADFDNQDLEIFESHFGTNFRDLVHLVDLTNTTYWKRPNWHENDNLATWKAYPLFSEGYRRMMHFFAIDVWRFFLDFGKETGCNYEYIMRFDEDSFLHSPVRYDIFNFMRDNGYFYGFRLCAYEMQVTQRIWKLWRRRKSSPKPVRDIDLEMCGVYNNFFIAKLALFQSDPVQQFLHFVDRKGLIYRKRLGDLMIHSMAIYAFSPQEKIHRFLDFTYEHGTVDPDTGCVVWGGIQAGFDDPNSDQILDDFYQKKVFQIRNCTNKDYIMSEESLSPTYSHLPQNLKGNLVVRSIMAGKVELPDKGSLSG